MRIEERLRATFHAAGVTGWLHVMDIDRPVRQIGLDAAQPVVLASVFKLPLLVALYREAAAGALDLTERVVVGGGTPGTTGLAVMEDPVELSLRDAAYLMIAVSDVAAADVVWDRVGQDAVDRTLEALGLSATRIIGSSRDVLAAMMRDSEAADAEDLAAKLRDPAVLARLGVLDAARTNAATAQECTALLAALWRDEAADADSCAAMRRLLGLQVWPHRLSAGFPSDDVRVSGKTGTLPTIRNEVGVVEHPDGGRFAAAVFTRSVDSVRATLPQADAAIGTAARMAIEELRRR